MDTLTIFAVVALAGMIHAGFHLSVSVLTLLSGHTISKEKSRLKLLKLLFAFIFGVLFMNTLLFSGLSFIAQTTLSSRANTLMWLIIIGVLVGTGISVWLFYYRRSAQKTNSTEMWVPRNFAKYLDNRARKTQHSAEAFSLGMTSVFSELLFILAPLLTAVFATIELGKANQLLSLLTYILISILPLIVIALIISGGNSIVKIQLWRTKNKHFIQFAVGSGLIILAGFLYISIIVPIIGVLII